MPKNKLTIVYYHTISDDDLEIFPKSDTQSIDTFNRQIKYLNKRYNIISLDEAFHKYQNGDKFENNLVITTDDGFKENYTVISPVLSDLKLTFTSFLCNDLIDNKKLMWRNVLYYLSNNFSHDRIHSASLELCEDYKLDPPLKNETCLGWSLRAWPYDMKDTLSVTLWNKLCQVTTSEYLAKKQPYLNSNQINEMLDSGFFIGSHSRTHPYFKKLTIDEMRFESIEAAEDLGKLFKTEINSFSFPFERPEGFENADSSLVDKVLSEKFNVVLGTRDKGLNHKQNPRAWERVCMEFKFNFSLVNLHVSPLKERLL